MSATPNAENFDSITFIALSWIIFCGLRYVVGRVQGGGGRGVGGVALCCGWGGGGVVGVGLCCGYGSI